jgi:hypothetical protein
MIVVFYKHKEKDIRFHKKWNENWNQNYEIKRRDAAHVNS